MKKIYALLGVVILLFSWLIISSVLPGTAYPVAGQFSTSNQNAISAALFNTSILSSCGARSYHSEYHFSTFQPGC